MKEFVDWVVTKAPWIVPLFAVLSLTFVVVPSAAKRGYDELIGPVLNVADEKDFEPFDKRSPSPRQALWEEVISAATSAPRVVVTVVALVVVYLLCIYRFILGDRPITALRWSRNADPRAVASWGFLGGCLLFLGLYYWQLPNYLAPLRLNDLAAKLMTPADFEREAGAWLKVPFTNLFSWLHGVPEAEKGRQTADLDWSSLTKVNDFFEGLAGWTFLSFLLLLGLSALGSALMSRARLASDRPFQTALALLLPFLVLITHATQWVWLANNFGRLRVAAPMLKKLANSDEALPDPDHLGNWRDFARTWPFRVADFGDADKEGRHASVKVTSVWPAPERRKECLKATFTPARISEARLHCHDIGEAAVIPLPIGCEEALLFDPWNRKQVGKVLCP